MNKNILSVLIAIAGIFIFGVIPGFVNAQAADSTSQTQQTLSNVQYPIKELGNCQSKEDCSVFCDKPENSNACLTFASQHDLMSSSEVAVAKKFIDNGMVGPGKCKGQDECSQYCGNSDHLEECTNFAEKNGMMSDQQLKDSKKVLAAMKNGLKPPACSGPQQCNAYCSSPKHMEECMTFSLAAGIVSDDQKAQMQKTLDAIKQGIKPPACQPTPPPDQVGQSSQADQSSGLESCDTYCSDPSHAEECMTFSLAAGMVPDDQKAQMQKTLDVIKQGIKPPACQPNQSNQSGQQGQSGQPGSAGDPNEGQGNNPGSGQNSNGPGNSQSGSKVQFNKPSQSGQGLQSCDEYCADSSHVEECVKFSVAIGNMTETQAQSAIKTGGKGPGGCIGKNACDTFCNNPDNQDTCFNFAKENGMIPEADLQKMQEGQQKMKDAFSSIPPEVVDCLTSTVGADVVEKMKTGSVIGRKFGDSINQCFQKFNVREGTPNGNGPGSDQGGQSGQNQNGQDQQNQQGRDNQSGQGQPNQNQQIQPWADMCKPDVNGNPTSLACADGDGKFVVSAKVGSDGKPVCPAGSSAKCGDYPQNNQQQNQQNQQGQGDNPGSGQNGNGQGNQPGQQGQPNQQGQSNQQNQNQPNQPGQPNQPEQGGANVSGPGPCGTGPGTCSGIGPDDINPNQPGQQPGQMQPQQQPQPPQQQQQNPPPPPPPTSFMNTNSFIGSLIDAMFKFLTKH